jgi:hypothetical protein
VPLLVYCDVTRSQTGLYHLRPIVSTYPFGFDLLESTHFAHRDSELALEQIEAQISISLSRTVGTPNILSKGILEQRAISIPLALFPPGHPHRALLDKSSSKKLIEEVSGIPATPSSLDHVHLRDSVMPHSNGASETPSWTWGQEGGEIRITIAVPKLVSTQLP